MTNSEDNVSGKGAISVSEAGRKGGQSTSRTHGPEFYRQIGQKGGRRVSELIRKARNAEELVNS